MDILSTTYIATSSDLPRPISNRQQDERIPTKDIGLTHNRQSDLDTVTLSEKGLNLAKSSSFSGKNADQKSNSETTDNLDKAQLQELQKLKKRDIEVRTHEQAHLSAAGRFARGGASFSYQKGPDGASYAVSGEVGIDMSKEKTPEATIAKMRIIKRAALAPVSPSAADKSIAAQASMIESQSRQESLVQSQEELLHLDTAKNHAGDQNVKNENNIPIKIQPSTTYNTLRTMIATYERVSSHSS